MSDPLEGAYGRTKAMVMRRDHCSTWFNSFAHGRTVYELRSDARTVAAAIDAGPNDQAADIFVRLASLPPNQDVSAMSAGKMIKRHVGEPVQADDCILILKSGEDGHSKSANFYVLAS
jgi:hypothetical protein